MESTHYTTEFWVDETPDTVFAAILNVPGYWTIDGDTAQQGDEFVHRHEGALYSRFRVAEVVPGQRVVWQVLVSHLDFVAEHDEWTGTRVLFEVNPKDGGTRLRFTHEGLSPAKECWTACSRGWDDVINQNLKNLITGHTPGERRSTMLDTTALRNAYRTLLDAAATVADAGYATPAPPPGEWNADQILAHIALVNAATITTVSSAASGHITTYDNRLAQDPWTLEHVIALAGGNQGLRERIRLQADALCALGGPMLSEAELDTLVPALLVSNSTVLVDQPVPLRDLITGLAEVELPGHTQQLLALLPEAAKAASAT
ncbi:SRPBCC family protein [Streptomyces sp. MAR4 CNY-716]